MLDDLRAAVPVRAPGVWVVGGAVRDALLGIAPRELDLLVEGDAVALARSVGDVVAVHERFGTATVRVDGTLVDLASARRESYPAPGALPEVELGASVEEDLRRRDFTVNAMAVRVEDGLFREFPGASDDLRARRLRVLHDRSYSDDPTRMLRGARYAARLGFVLVDDMDPSLLEAVTPSRAGNELRLALSEPQPRALEALDAFGLGRALLGGFWRFEASLVQRALALHPSPLTALAATLRDAERPPDRPMSGHEGRSALGGRLEELGFAARERDVLVEAAQIPPLRPVIPGDPVVLWRALRRVAPEAAAVAGARGDGEAARRWLTELRHVRPEIGGDDLLEAGLSGRAIGAALERATEAALRGEPRDEQLRLALGEDAGS